MLHQLQFTTMEFNSRRQVLTGVDTSNRFLIKIEVEKNINKENSIREEFEILKLLNERGSKTCATVHEFGKIEAPTILPLLSEKDKETLTATGKDSFGYIIQDYIPHSDNYRFADMILSIIEQKKLGVYQGDLKPANLRFNADTGICYIIDYDQAVLLEDNLRNADNNTFFNFCSGYDLQKYGFGDWLRHFPNYTHEQLEQLFVGGSFDLGKTTIFDKQVTTNTINGIYHTIKEKDIFIDGSRTLETRSKVLDQLSFRPGETVLDVGCNSGLLSMYLCDRGCKVTGIDIDKYIVIVSKIISNILGKDIHYEHADLDHMTPVPAYDTVMLFSVLHHTKDPVSNAKKIAASCSRIILETRMMERGKQPINGSWVNTSSWLFRDINELLSFCGNIFEGFKLRKNLGSVDKNRFIFEFVKEGV